MLAWLLQRISGLMLMVFVGLKILSGYVLSGEIDLGGPVGETHVHKLVDIPILLLFLYHTLNGIRVMLIDLGVNVRYEKVLFWTLSGVGVLTFSLVVFLIYGT